MKDLLSSKDCRRKISRQQHPSSEEIASNWLFSAPTAKAWFNNRYFLQIDRAISANQIAHSVVFNQWEYFSTKTFKTIKQQPIVSLVCPPIRSRMTLFLTNENFSIKPEFGGRSEEERLPYYDQSSKPIKLKTVTLCKIVLAVITNSEIKI